MADPIQSSATFAIANMKPSSSGTENIDAIWGRNVADNTGWLRRKPNYFAASFGTDGTSRTSVANPYTIEAEYKVLFQRWEGHNHIYGTMTAFGTFQNVGNPDCYGTYGPRIYGDLGTWSSAISSFATANIGADYTFGSTFAFGVNLDSYVSAGSWATLVCRFLGTSDDSVSNRTSSVNFGTPAKIYTTWV